MLATKEGYNMSRAGYAVLYDICHAIKDEMIRCFDPGNPGLEHFCSLKKLVHTTFMPVIMEP